MPEEDEAITTSLRVRASILAIKSRLKSSLSGAFYRVSAKTCLRLNGTLVLYLLNEIDICKVGIDVIDKCIV
jgi:hypothetical protein